MNLTVAVKTPAPLAASPIFLLPGAPLLHTGSINLVKNVMATIYPQSTGDASALSTAALVGAVLGQLFFGAMADKFGRRVIFVSTISLVIISAFGSALVFESSNFSIYTQLSIWRFLLGFGVGGEYPLSATVTSEGSVTVQRGRAISSVFAMQGFGNLTAGFVTYALLAANVPVDLVWRLALGFGGVPGLLTVYWRYRMEESHAFTTAAAKEAQLEEGSGTTSAAGDVAVVKANPLAAADAIPDAFAAGSSKAPAAAASAPVHIPACAHPLIAALTRTCAIILRYKWALLGTAGTWFIFDVVFYANSLFSGTVLSKIGYSSGSLGTQTEEQLTKLALGNMIISLIGLPGYLVGVATIDCMGRRPMQIMGFIAVGVVFLILGGAYNELLTSSLLPLFVFLYGLTFFFANFGANLSTFVIPAECFPTKAKASCHGISAASGKIGAALGAAAMQPLITASANGLQTVLYICAGLSFLGLAWTLWLTVETMGLETSCLDDDDTLGDNYLFASNEKRAEIAHKAPADGAAGGDYLVSASGAMVPTLAPTPKKSSELTRLITA